MTSCRSGLVAGVSLLAFGLAAFATYTVQPGDTLSGIAVEQRTTVKALVEHNGITNPDLIVAGQVLRLPGPATGGSATSAATHTVAPGETLSEIAARYGVETRALAEANGLSDANLIRAGQRLTVSGSAGSAGSTASEPAREVAREDVGDLIERVAGQHGWNPAFVKAIAHQESGWNNQVVSSAGAVGIMQVLPSTGQWVSRYLAGRTLDLGDPEDNVLAGVLFLDYLHSITGGDVRLILGGYYQGIQSMRDNGVYDSTEHYIDNVLALRTRFV